jgi:hypothetical protein
VRYNSSNYFYDTNLRRKCDILYRQNEGIIMDWSLILGSSGLAGVAYLIFKMGQFIQKFESFTKEVNKKFDSIDKQFDSIDKQFELLKVEHKEIKNYLVSIDIRLSVIEAENIVYNTISDSNVRSEAAKERWRKKKELERKQLAAK